MSFLNSVILYPLLKTVIILIYIVSHIYDYLTYPIWCLIQKPWRVLRHRKGIHSKWEEHPDGLMYHSKVEPSDLNRDMKRYNLNTMEKVFSYVAGQFSTKDCLGTREIISETKEKQPDGKVHLKYDLGNYKWISFRQFGDSAEKFGRGLRELGLEPRERLVMLAETRADWIIAAYGCFQNSLTIVTLYTNLGDSGIVHGVNETEVSTIICSYETYGKVRAVLDQLPNVKNIIVMEDLAGKPLQVGEVREGVKVVPFKACIELGGDCVGNGAGTVTQKACPPGPNDLAIIMYTSGSTGVPKGVMLSHHNLVSAMGSLCNIADFRPNKDRYIAFLPLAHVLELLAESSCLMYGIKIGYSSSLTLTTKSSKVKNGCKGDANVLKPTLMCTVPIILERIYKSIVDTMKRQGWWAEELFHYMVAYKMKWQDRGFDTPLLNKTIFRKIRYFLGGKVRLMLSGGAPLGDETHGLARTCLCVPIMQGFGLTETTACATVTSIRDRTTGRVGAPLMNVDMKLLNWEEGGYRVTDKPSPRGEIHIGGDNVAVGYFNNEKATGEEFYEAEGRRWFRTGDIGAFQHDGVLKIIDRKKDLIKLQHGEFVSYGRVESILTTAPIIESICSYGDPSKDFIVAIIIPDKHKLKNIEAAQNLSVAEAVDDPDVIKEVVKQVKEYGIKNGLKGFEIPARVLLVNDEWTAENGLVTAAFKIRRKFIVQNYIERITELYNTK